MEHSFLLSTSLGVATVHSESPRKILSSFSKLSAAVSRGEASLLAGDVGVSSATEIVLTFPAGGGAGNINYYRVVLPIVTLNFSELLPPHRTVSRCLEQCAEPA